VKVLAVHETSFTFHVDLFSEEYINLKKLVLHTLIPDTISTNKDYDMKARKKY